MSWLSEFQRILAKILPFVEPVVKAVETSTAAATAPGATKQSIALAALTGTTDIAEAGLSAADGPTISAVSSAVADAINGTVADLKQSGTIADGLGVADTVTQAVETIAAAVVTPAPPVTSTSTGTPPPPTA